MTATLASYVFASAAVDERGMATCFWAVDRAFGGPALTLLDYADRQSLASDTFAALRGGLCAAAAAVSARPVPLLFASATLAAHARAANEAWADAVIGACSAGDWDRAWAIELRAEAMPPEILRDREALILTAASAVAAGRIKLADAAHARSLTLPLPLFGPAADARPGALADALLIGIAAAEMKPPTKPIPPSRNRN